MNLENIKTTNTPKKDKKTVLMKENNEMEKEIHMTGRAMRIDETSKEYKKEREESWEEIKKEQAKKDQGEIVELQKKIVGDNENKKGTQETDESYKDLPNVKLCEKKLTALLKKHQKGDNFSDRARTIIYKMLTQRSEYVKNTDGAGKDAVELMDDYKPQMKWYRDTRETMEKSIDANSEFKSSSNPGWFGINTHPEAEISKDINIKAYITIPTTDYTFIQHLPKLAIELRKLSLKSNDIIQVKIPESLSGFMSHNDSIVVHFKNKINSETILKILDTWMQANNIHESPREMGRTKIAADSKDTSFSDLVAKNIADWLEQKAEKYDNSILISEAIKHAIRQSQKSPI